LWPNQRMCIWIHIQGISIKSVWWWSSAVPQSASSPLYDCVVFIVYVTF
jgi:hypothetical protein